MKAHVVFNTPHRLRKRICVDQYPYIDFHMFQQLFICAEFECKTSVITLDIQFFLFFLVSTGLL